MKNECAYIIVYDWMAQAVGKECHLFALLCAYAGADGCVQMSRGYMAHRLARDVRSIDYELKALQEKGCIRKLSAGGAGRSDATTYEITLEEYKKLYPKGEEKSTKNCTLKNEKEYKKLYPKRVQKIVPHNNIIINNNAAEQQDAHARANDSMNTDYNFAEFWELFKPSAEHQSKRISCLNEWARKTDEQRAMMLAILKTGKQHRDNPLFFIRYCDENYTKVVYTRDEIYKQEHTTEPVGYCILEKTDPDGLALWCRTDDAKAMGWNIRREFSA